MDANDRTAGLLARYIAEKRQGTPALRQQRQFNRTAKQRLKQCYINLIKRCTDPRHVSYPYYGGKGIQNFLTPEDLKFLWDRDGADSMVKPSIDREKSDQHYRRENCRFIEQSENSRRTAIGRTTSRGSRPCRSTNFKLRSLIKAAFPRQRQFCAATGMKEARLSQIIRGRIIPNETDVAFFISVLGQSASLAFENTHEGSVT